MGAAVAVAARTVRIAAMENFIVGYMPQTSWGLVG
jgi:hypothetical protein